MQVMLRYPQAIGCAGSCNVKCLCSDFTPFAYDFKFFLWSFRYFPWSFQQKAPADSWRCTQQCFNALRHPELTASAGISPYSWVPISPDFPISTYESFSFPVESYSKEDALAQFHQVQKETLKSNNRWYPYTAYEYDGETFYSIEYCGIADESEIQNRTL